MKKIILLAFAVLCSSMAFSQNSSSFYRSSYESRNSGSFDQSTSIISLGYGFPNVPTNDYAGLTSNRAAFGPIYAKYEHGFLRDEIGIGGQVAFSFGRVKYLNYVDHVNAIDIGVLGFYHFNKLIPVEKLDVYAGLGFTIRSVSESVDNNNGGFYTSGAGTAVYAAFRVGARYYVQSNLGLFADVGYDNMSVLNLGVTFKLH